MVDSNEPTLIVVTIPTVEGFLGRQCQDPGCGRYFRVMTEVARTDLICPYCGVPQAFDDLDTDEQRALLEGAAEEKAFEIAEQEFDRMLSDVFNSHTSNGSVSLSYSPGHGEHSEPQPTYIEPSVDSELRCPVCAFAFQVKGIFGYCPACRSENLRIYDASLAVLRHEIGQSSDPRRALRGAYGDLVAMFETYCSRRAKAIAAPHGSFQDPFEARRFFQVQRQVDILAGLTFEEQLRLRRLFQKRHACIHSEGELNDRYVRAVPEDRSLLGTKAVLSLEELVAVADIVRRILDRVP